MSLASDEASIRLFTAAYSTPDDRPVPEAPTAPPTPQLPLERALAPPERRLPDSTLAEGQLVYRCGDCGALGDLRRFPVRCLDCDAPREELYYEIED